MLRLSIIVPVYNKQAHLAKCLESLIRQSYSNIEIICVNDGSTDASLQVLEHYAARDKRISIISQNNRGVSAARNAGMKAATGRYISFMDADDYLDAQAYSCAMPLFKIYQNIDLVAFGAEVLLGEAGAVKLKSDDSYYSAHHSGAVKLTPKILFQENLSVCTKIFRLDLIRKKNIFFAEGFHYEDFEFCWKYMIHAKNAYFLKDRFYKYLRYRVSIMASTFTGSDKAIDHLYLTERLFSYFKEMGRNGILETEGANLFTANFWFSYRYSTVEKRKEVLALAKNIVTKFQLYKLYPHNALIGDIFRDEMHKYKNIDEYSFLQKIFSVKKLLYLRYVKILGLKFTFKRKSYKKIQSLLN